MLSITRDGWVLLWTTGYTILWAQAERMLIKRIKQSNIVRDMSIFMGRIKAVAPRTTAFMINHYNQNL